MTVTPFDWLEASYFYYRPDDFFWGGQKGLYLDKGFNVKFLYKPTNKFLPDFAVGLDDFAGTGLFTKEYAVATYEFKNIKISSGIGWGKFVGNDNSFENPIGKISNEFYKRKRSSSNFDTGGTPSTDLWFKGDAILFGGIEIPFGKRKNISLKIESNPLNYLDFSCCSQPSLETFEVRKTDKDINFGISYKFLEFGNIDFSYIKGNTFNLTIAFGFSSNKNYVKKSKFEPKVINTNFNQNKKNEFYYDLLENLNKNNLFLQTADLDDDVLSISIDSPNIENPIQYTSRTAIIAQKVLKNNDIKTKYINVGNITRGMEINNIEYEYEDIKNLRRPIILTKRNTKIKNIDPKNYKNDEFQPKVMFPVISFNLSPDIRSHVGSPERFLFSGIGLKLNTEIQINRNLTLYSVIGQNLTNNFDEKVSRPSSRLPLVRTEIVDYLQQSDNLYIRNLQIDYISSISKNLSYRWTAGYLEEMYGGISTEVLYKPFKSNFATSIEINKIKKRFYDGRFDFLDYENTTHHLNIAYYEPNSNILLKWSYGEYLAGDRGYTLDLSRRMPSGWRGGFYFSRTNVSARDFGEGSFDKGFYFYVPFNIFQESYTKEGFGFSLKTLTRDGGQKLIINNRLIDSFYGSSLTEINESWQNYGK